MNKLVQLQIKIRATSLGFNLFNYLLVAFRLLLAANARIRARAILNKRLKPLGGFFLFFGIPRLKSWAIKITAL